MSNDFNIVNPNAAFVLFNYDERLGPKPSNESKSNNLSGIRRITKSLIGLNTVKQKGKPTGQFTVTLAPTRNWIAAITPGSWCAVLMSRDVINKSDIKDKANPKQVKMIGRIETVRSKVSVGANGTRSTIYTVSGSDWGWMLNNVLYIDPLIGAGDQTNTANANFIEVLNLLMREDPTSKKKIFRSTADMLVSLKGILGEGVSEGTVKTGKAINRIAKSTYSPKLPASLVQWMGFVDRSGSKIKSELLSSIINLDTGKLKDGQNGKLEEVNDAMGFINPFHLTGQHSLWQVLLEHSNPVLNEMFCDMVWEDFNGEMKPRLSLTNRIKPFSIDNQDTEHGPAIPGGSPNLVSNLRSKYKDIRKHKIPLNDILSIEAGDNFRDKYNFIEIKPAFQGAEILESMIKTRTQYADTGAFQREGFRPFIVSTRQYPGDPNATEPKPNWEVLYSWKYLLKEWYFITHRTLNGSLAFIGQDGHISIGDNIMVPLVAFNKGGNIKSGSTDKDFLLLHVESISHNFNVDAAGARSFMTNVQFVRGIVVDKEGNPIGDGLLDDRATTMTDEDELNSINVFDFSTDNDPIKKD